MKHSVPWPSLHWDAFNRCSKRKFYITCQNALQSMPKMLCKVCPKCFAKYAQSAFQNLSVQWNLGSNILIGYYLLRFRTRSVWHDPDQGRGVNVCELLAGLPLRNATTKLRQEDAGSVRLPMTSLASSSESATTTNAPSPVHDHSSSTAAATASTTTPRFRSKRRMSRNRSRNTSLSSSWEKLRAHTEPQFPPIQTGKIWGSHARTIWAN